MNSYFIHILDIFDIFDNNKMQKVLASEHKEKPFDLEKRKRFLTMIFKHMAKFNSSEIAQAVLLISMSNDQAKIFDELASIKRGPSEKSAPCLFKFGNNIKLIDPSEYLFQPQIEHRFVTMHYLMRTIKRVKFIFVFTHSQTGNRPMRQIRDTLQKILKMVDKNVDMDELSKSCAIMIIDDDLDFDLQSYKQRIIDLGLEQKNFVTDQRINDLGKFIFGHKRVLLCNQARNNLNKKGGDVGLKKDEIRGLKYSFLSLIQQLDYFQISKNFCPSLPSNYQDYIECNIHMIWKEMYNLLYKNMDVFVTGQLSSIQQRQIRTKEDKLRKQGQAFLISQINMIGNFSMLFEADTPQPHLKDHRASLRLLTFINSFFQILEDMLVKSKQSPLLQIYVMKDIVGKLLQALQRGQYIINPAIRTFFMSYFEIHDFLDTGSYQTTVIRRYDFIDNIRDFQSFNALMGIFVLRFLHLLENDLTTNDRTAKYQYDQISEGINQMLQHFKHNEFTFVTDRIIKKITKCQANLAYKQAKESMQTSNFDKTVNLFLVFLSYACKCPLISRQCIDQAYIYLGDELTCAKKWKLALDMYDMVPEYKSYLGIIKLYEKGLQLAPQLIKYMTKDDWANNLCFFRQYCKFLTKIGLNQKTRQLCLEGLRVAEDQDVLEAISSELINARGDTSRDAHLNFLEHSILEERLPYHNPILLDNVRNILSKNNDK